MKKTYVFNNYFPNRRDKRPYYQTEIEAETVLEAKKKLKDKGHDDLRFSTIKKINVK